ncbi:hypothetical protein [Paenibacillus sp. PDC88]|uniref:hypothetical protein n=1 Tax=Paenibacillus sp. PDC88 TaxID=1884375 RepID=UPI00210C5D0C|nr:hypothetical protein [Paenibacillus sp. PDC88]
MRKIFGKSDISYDTYQTSNDPSRLPLPDRIDGAIDRHVIYENSSFHWIPVKTCR